MLYIIFFYLVLPFLLGAMVVRLIRKRGKDTVAPEAHALYERAPINPKWFRVARLEGRSGEPGVRLRLLDDCDTQEKAVDAAYMAKSQDPGAGILVLNDKGEILQEV